MIHRDIVAQFLGEVFDGQETLSSAGPETGGAIIGDP